MNHVNENFARLPFLQPEEVITVLHRLSLEVVRRMSQKEHLGVLRECTDDTDGGYVSSPRNIRDEEAAKLLRIWDGLSDSLRTDPALSSFRFTLMERFKNKNMPSTSDCKENYSSCEINKKTDENSNYSLHKSKESSEDQRKVNPKLIIDEGGSYETEKFSTKQRYYKHFKNIVLLMGWFAFTLVLMIKGEKVLDLHQISIPKNLTRTYIWPEDVMSTEVHLILEGAFLPKPYHNMSQKHLKLWLDLASLPHNLDKRLLRENITLANDETMITGAQNISDIWVLPLVTESLIDLVPQTHVSKRFKLQNTTNLNLMAMYRKVLRVRMATDMELSISVAIHCDSNPITMSESIIYAAIVLLGFYILIIFDVMHRTLAALYTSTISVAILAALDERPSLTELISWIDMETLLLLFSMMMLVCIFTKTGIFDFFAVYAYKITGGRIWPLLTTICIFTTFLSCFLDSVTTVLLMTPVVIRLCEVSSLNSGPILIAMLIYCNIGGGITPVGDPPNVIIASNKAITDSGVNFTKFIMHMGPGALIVFVVVYFLLRLLYRRPTDFPLPDPEALRHEIVVWRRAAASLSSYSKDEDAVRESMLQKARGLREEFKLKINGRDEVYRATLEELKVKYPIRDWSLLIKSTITLLFVIILFFLHSVPELKVSLGWIALLGALLLLLLATSEDIEAVLARVEWPTLLFFAALFVLMEAVSKLGLIDWIGNQTEGVILSVDENSRLAVAILLILWVSAFASSFIDNIPVATMMVKIVASLAANEELNLPLQPLVWALAFGASLGGNGTLLGSSSNLICLGVADQHGYRFSFMDFFKVGFPVTIVSVIVISGYLMICHVLFQWHD